MSEFIKVMVLINIMMLSIDSCSAKSRLGQVEYNTRQLRFDNDNLQRKVHDLDVKIDRLESRIKRY